MTDYKELADRVEKHGRSPRLWEISSEIVTALREQNAKIDRLRAEGAIMWDALERLSRLGNEPNLGNSDGNVIAQDAIKRVEALAEQYE